MRLSQKLWFVAPHGRVECVAWRPEAEVHESRVNVNRLQTIFAGIRSLLKIRAFESAARVTDLQRLAHWPSLACPNISLAVRVISPARSRM